MASSAPAEHGKDDATFMATCLSCYDNNLNKIDLTAVAKCLNKGPKSVESKFYALKKKHGFTIKVTFNKAQHGEASSPTKVVKTKGTPKKTNKSSKVKAEAPSSPLMAPKTEESPGALDHVPSHGSESPESATESETEIH